jgi:hypothetical protein
MFDPFNPLAHCGWKVARDLLKSKGAPQVFLLERALSFFANGGFFKTCLLTLGSPLWYKSLKVTRITQRVIGVFRE